MVNCTFRDGCFAKIREGDGRGIGKGGRGLNRAGKRKVVSQSGSSTLNRAEEIVSVFMFSQVVSTE